MSGTELWGKPVAELHGLIASRRASVREVTSAFLHRAAAAEPSLHAWNALLPEMALAQADELDREIAAGREVGLLTGIPIGIKDNMCVAGARATAGSRILERFVPTYDATVVARLKREGAVAIGKTNLDEFAMGSSTENSAFGPTRNPWDPSRAPGGSSGGSAAAVAARCVPWALGSDTGGSIRQPAAFCGVVGMKPTYGRVSRFGLIAFASSLDQIGPFAASVRDVAVLLRAIAGHDPRDATSVSREVPDYPAVLAERGPAGVKLGIPAGWTGAGLDAGIGARLDEVARGLAARGAVVTTVELPHAGHAIPVYYLVATAEASSNLARYDGVRYGHRGAGASDLADMYARSRTEGFGREVKRRIMLGTYALSAGYYDAYYLKAQKVRTLIRRDFERAFREVDLILGPATPTPPFPLGEKVDDPLAMYLSDVYTTPASLAGLPAISVPAGFAAGLPVGLQLIGRPFDEVGVLAGARWVEEIAGPCAAAPLPPAGGPA